MGSSAKKKREKKKDFQKTKLKVGKARPKAANHTDTSFKAKAIVLNQQSLRTDAPSTIGQVQHHLSLLGSRSESQRKESLAHLTTVLGANVHNVAYAVPAEQFIDKLMPLLLDVSHGVRTNVLGLLQVLPVQSVQENIIRILPFVRAALTHLSQDIRKAALDVLDWLLETAAEELVTCPGGWSKTLGCCMMLLDWQQRGVSDTWSITKATLRTDPKVNIKAMQVVERLLYSGLIGHAQSVPSDRMVHRGYPLHDRSYHAVSTNSNAFSHLNLFGQPTDDDSQALEDPTDRLQVFGARFKAEILAGVANAKQEGGDAGRVAGQISKVVDKAVLED